MLPQARRRADAGRRVHALVRARNVPTEAVDLVMVSRIRDEGLKHSQVMDTVEELTDVIGPRLTGSPQMRKASDWTRARLAGWGLANAHLETWGPFGRGWSYERSTVTMVAPQVVPLIAVPKAWTPGTAGAVRGNGQARAHQHQGGLRAAQGQAGRARAVPLAAAHDARARAPAVRALQRRRAERASHFDVAEAADTDNEEPRRTRRRFQRELTEFLAAEKALATVEVSERDGAIVRVMGGGSRDKDDNPGVPALVMAAEHYNRVLRLLEKKQDVELELDVKATFHDEDPTSANTFAEIPGTAEGGEVVMAGAHLDSWHAGTGATDNAAGSAVVMEAIRILKAIDVKPRRTIRVGLWSGEEAGPPRARAPTSSSTSARARTRRRRGARRTSGARGARSP